MVTEKPWFVPPVTTKEAPSNNIQIAIIRVEDLENLSTTPWMPMTSAGILFF
jgi:hypothetical protein